MAFKKHQKSQSKRKSSFWLKAILLLALVVRLYKLETPLADWHSWRQVDTASVAVEYVKNGINLLEPKYLDVSNIPSGKENLMGYRMVEFPLMSGVVALAYQGLGNQDIPLHVFYRLFSIILSVGSTWLIYRIVKRFEDEKVALLSSLVFAILPFNIFYSRSVLPEVSLVFFTLLELFAVTEYFHSKQSFKNPYFWLGAISGAIAMLVKPYALALMLPMMYLGFKKNGIKFLWDKKVYVYSLIILAPFLWWRQWIAQYPEGIPAYLWLLNGNGIRFKGSFFHWIFAERIGKLILGYWGVFLLGLGFLKKSYQDKTHHFFTWWLIALLTYISVFATGNVQHDYYQIILMPLISIYVAKGIVFLLHQKSISSKLLLLTSVSFMLAFSWYEIRGYFNINNPAIVEAGIFVDQNIPDDALVIAPYMGDTAFLYQTNRRGWPIGGSIEEKIIDGAQYYVTTALDDEAKDLLSRCSGAMEKNDQFTLINLNLCSWQDEGELINQEPVDQKEKVDTIEEVIVSSTPTPVPTPELIEKNPTWPPGKSKKKK